MASNKYAEFGIEGNAFKVAALQDHDFWYPSLWSKTLYADSADLANDSLVKFTNNLTMFCHHLGFYYGVQSEVFGAPKDL